MSAIGHPELAEDPRYYPQTNLQANIEEFYDFLVAEMASSAVTAPICSRNPRSS